jgi:hypothetical protein
MAGPTSITAVDTANEKSPEVQETSTGTASPATEKEASIVSDGDDALKVAGTDAHHFDEKYYARLKRKIVRLPMPFLAQPMDFKLIMIVTGLARDADSCFCVLYTVLGQEHSGICCYHGLPHNRDSLQ